MGCGSSKAVAVVPQTVTEAWALPEHEGKKSPGPISGQSVRSGSSRSAQNDHHEERGVKRDRKNAKAERETGCPQIMMVQEASEDAQRAVHIKDEESIRIQNSRINSASSNDSEVSDQTTDSGLGDEDRAKIITEKSGAELQEVAHVPDSLKLPDLTIDGIKLATLIDPFDHRQKMATKRQNMQSKQIPSESKQVKFAAKIPDGPNTIKRPTGIAFDILLEDSNSDGNFAIKRAPTALARLKKKQREVTKEELDEKQKRAQQRREELKQQLQERIQAKHERDKQMQEALDKFAASCIEKTTKKMEETTNNRDAHLQAIREHMKEKSRHAEQVRASNEAKKHTALRPPAQSDNK